MVFHKIIIVCTPEKYRSCILKNCKCLLGFSTSINLNNDIFIWVTITSGIHRLPNKTERFLQLNGDHGAHCDERIFLGPSSVSPTIAPRKKKQIFYVFYLFYVHLIGLNLICQSTAFGCHLHLHLLLSISVSLFHRGQGSVPSQSTHTQSAPEESEDIVCASYKQAQ